MNIVSVLALIEKGISVAELLIAAGKSAAPAFSVLKDLVTGAQNKTVSDAQLTATEAALDQLLADFNEPLSG